jgi:HD-GYP domain-containing protein (c-di-GMP phosphodiesterase class II)
MDLVAQIHALNRIGIALSSETNLQILMELILEESRKLTGADGGSLYLKEKNNLIFYVTQNKTLNDRSDFSGGFKHHILPISKKSFAGFVATTGEVLTIEDAYNLPSSAPYKFNYDFDKDNNYRTRSVLVVPLKTPDGDIVGVMQLINATDKKGIVVSFPDDLIPLASSLASQAGVALRNARLIHDIKILLRSIIQFSASAIDARSPHTAGHSLRVAGYSRAIVDAINEDSSGPFADIFFTAEQQEELYYSAWLHDIGKIGIPESVLDKQNKLSDAEMSAIQSRFELIKTIEISDLRQGKKVEGLDAEAVKSRQENIVNDFEEKFGFINQVNTSIFLNDADAERLKLLAGSRFQTFDGNIHPYLEDGEFEALAVRKGNLTDEEYKKIQSHVVHTQQIVEKIPFPEFLENVPLYASSHHEKLDGSGYPNGLKGGEFPLQARILAVVDVYDALTAVDRPYRKSMPVEQAFDILRQEADRDHLDKNLVGLFIDKQLYKVIHSDSQSDSIL